MASGPPGAKVPLARPFGIFHQRLNDCFMKMRLHILCDISGCGLCCAFGLMQILFSIHGHDDFVLIHGQIVYVRFGSVLASCAEF